MTVPLAEGVAEADRLAKAPLDADPDSDFVTAVRTLVDVLGAVYPLAEEVES